MSSEKSVFPCSLHNSTVRVSHFRTFLIDNETVLLQALFCEILAKNGINTNPDEIELISFLVWVKQSVTRCTDIFLDCRCVPCDFWSFTQGRQIVSNDSCNTFLLERLQHEQLQKTEWLVELWTHVLCFDQINFITRVGMPLEMNVGNGLWLPNSRIGYCLEFLSMRDREITCVYVLFPTKSPVIRPFSRI